MSAAGEAKRAKAMSVDDQVVQLTTELGNLVQHVVQHLAQRFSTGAPTQHPSFPST